MPCGRPWCIVISYEIECASAVRVFENARPAVSAANAIRLRSSMSPRSLHQLRQRREHLARRGDGEVVGHRIGIDVPDRLERMRQRIEAALRASPPAAATASARGRPAPPRARFPSGAANISCRRARSQIVAHGVTSLPVPAVVGTAISVLTRSAERRSGREQRDQASKLAALRADHQRLGGVERAAAADRDDRRPPHRAPEGVHRAQLGDVRVRRTWSTMPASGRRAGLEPGHQTERAASGNVTSGACRPASSFGKDEGSCPVHGCDGV